MGWMETCAVDERMRFVMAVEERDEAFAAVCRQFGVSRKTGYKWLERYREGGVEGLLDRSRAPLHHPQAVTEEIAERCLAVRREHPTWGPVKVRAWLERRAPQTAWPAGEHDRGAVRSRGADGEAPSAPPRPAVERAVCALRGGQRCLVHRFQRLVPDRRRHALRAADAERRPQPVSAALPGAGAHSTPIMCGRCWMRRSASSGCRIGCAPTTGRRSPRAGRADCRGCRSR